MARIVFVNPPFTPEERYGSLASAGEKTAPLGLCSLAAVCRDNGFDVKIIDAPALNWDYADVCKKIIDEKPDYVGITAVTAAVYNAASLAKLIKEKESSVKTIIGGPHLTAVPEETLKRFPQFDIGVIGEAETTIVELLRAYEDKKDLENIAGLIFRKNGGFRITAQRQFIKDLDRLPMPAWDLLAGFPRRYPLSAVAFSRLPAGSLITSRGCTGRCIFCDRKVFGNRCRAFSAEYIMAMIRHLYRKYGIREIEFEDDNFMLFPKRLTKLCQMLIDENLDLSWSCQGRIDHVTPEILKLMRRAGCWHIGYGIESGSQRILDLLKKDITVTEIKDAVKWTKGAGIKVWGYFMIGHPFETHRTIKETVDFATRLDLYDFHMTNFTPFPGSEIYRDIGRYGDFEDDWKKMNLWQPVFIPKGLTREEIIKYTKSAFKKFYLRPKTVISNLMMIRNPAHILRLIRGGLGLAKFCLEQREEDVTISDALRLYKNSSLGARLYNRIRSFLVHHFEEVESYVPKEGNIVDLACGYGMFTIFMASKSNKRHILGVDLIKERIESAKGILNQNKYIKNIEFKVQDIRDTELENTDGIVLMDVLCYLPLEEQEDLLKRCYDGLSKGGRAVIKTFDRKPSWKYILFYLQEASVITAKILKGSKPWKAIFKGRLFVRDSRKMQKTLEEIGFKVKTIRLDRMTHQSHIAYICHKQ